mgnify:FL=1|jgi:hypothetical protein
MSFEMALLAAFATLIGIPAAIHALGELLVSLDCRTASRQKRREIRAAMVQQPSPVTPGMTAMMCRLKGGRF